MPRKYRRAGRGRFFFFPFIAIILLLVMGGVVRFLWNAILPDLVAVNPITYWQAVGLLLLCRILFGNFGKGGGFPGHRHGPHQHAKRRYWREKWQQMSPEERAEMKEKWKKWWDK